MTGAILCFAFCLFMITVDVPMYVTRWKQNKKKKQYQEKRFSSSFEGAIDALERRVVSKSWKLWKEETVWLTGYFSGAVWLILLMVHYPVPSPL